jgi:hypothetical protein
MAEKSSPGIRQTEGKNLVWFGELERKLAKLSMPNFTYHSSSQLFYDPEPLLMCGPGGSEQQHAYLTTCSNYLFLPSRRLDEGVGGSQHHEFACKSFYYN